MSLSTYSGLQTAILNWLRRSNDTVLSAQVPDFITLFEEMANKDLRVSNMETSTTLSITSKNVSLPADYQFARALILTTASGTKKLFTPKTITQLYQEYPYSVTGEPAGFAPFGTNIRIAPDPDATYTAELIYGQTIPALSSTNTTNWLLTNYPSLYLYGSLMQAAPYLRNDDRVATWASLYQQGRDLLITNDEFGRYSGGTLVASPDPARVV